MKRISSFLPIALMGIILFAGCKKEDLIFFTAKTQPYSGQEKMHINASYFACWSTGDQIRINASVATATVTDGADRSRVELSGVPTSGSGYYAIYPAAFCAFAEPNEGGEVTISIPTEQEYRESGGVQVVNALMAAKANNDNVLVFKNLCTLLKITFPTTNNKISAIEVRSAGAHRKLSGTGTVTYDGSVPTLTGMNDETNTDRVVLTMSTPVSLVGGKSFYVPIPMINDDVISLGENFYVFVTDVMGRTTYKQVEVIDAAIGINSIAALAAPEVASVEDYQFCEYIESRGGAYIDLGVAPKVGSKMQLTFSITTQDAANASQYLCGSRGDGQNGLQWFTLTGSQSSPSVGFFATLCGKQVRNNENTDPSARTWSRVPNIKYRETVEACKDASNHIYGIATFEDLTNNYVNPPQETEHSTYTSFSGAPNIFVFGLRADQLHSGMRCYGFKYWEKNDSGDYILEHDFVPCTLLQPKTIGMVEYGIGSKGMYDKVADSFVPIIGTGYAG